MSMKEGTRIENREVTESVANGKIVFTLKQRVILTDMLDLCVDGVCTCTIPQKSFDEMVKKDFDGDREAAVQYLCDKGTNWLPVWYKANRGIGNSAPICFPSDW